MILSFACRETEKIWDGQTSRKLPRTIQDTALVKLRLLDAAIKIEDLRVPPGNHLERLTGRRKEQWSIRINKQWRICFIWTGNDAQDVEIIDYH